MTTKRKKYGDSRDALLDGQGMNDSTDAPDYGRGSTGELNGGLLPDGAVVVPPASALGNPCDPACRPVVVRTLFDVDGVLARLAELVTANVLDGRLLEPDHTVPVSLHEALAVVALLERRGALAADEVRRLGARMDVLLRAHPVAGITVQVAKSAGPCKMSECKQEAK